MKALASVNELGVLLSRRPATISRWARDGVIPAIFVGGKFVFDLDQVARWAERRDRPSRETLQGHQTRRSA